MVNYLPAIGLMLSLLIADPSIGAVETPPKTIGVSNANSAFTKKLCEKFNLEERQTEYSIPVIDKNTRKVIQKKSIVYEYVSKKGSSSRIIVWFQADPLASLGSLLQTISVLTPDKKVAVEIGRYFISSSNAGKSRIKKWNKSLNKVSFKEKPEHFAEYGVSPSIRCLSQTKVYKAKPVYTLEVHIVN